MRRRRNQLARPRSAARAVRKLALYSGRGLECPVCEGRFRRFETFRGRRNARCPGCAALERHRALWLYLRDETDLLSAPQSLLHFAPERGLARRFGSLANLHYVTADINPAVAAVHADLTALPFDADSFDSILCVHVLEHVPDDQAAMRELARVLRPGGVAYLQHPVDHRRDRTYEDWALTTEQQRLAAFGQGNHVRVYGRDLVARLEEAGFDVSVVAYVDELPADVLRRHALRSTSGSPRFRSDIYCCTA